ncbi:MAG: hypothetical protein AB1Z23_13090 [Eubacteriales bacterium]
MVFPNGSEYKLVFLDTNAIRSITDNVNGFSVAFYEKFVSSDEKYMPCFSFTNVMEIRPLQDMLARFIDSFSGMPCLMFYPYRLLIKEAHKAYLENTFFELNNHFDVPP